MKGPNEEIGKAPLGLSLSVFRPANGQKHVARESPEFHKKFVKFEESTKCSRGQRRDWVWLGYLGIQGIAQIWLVSGLT